MTIYHLPHINNQDPQGKVKYTLNYARAGGGPRSPSAHAWLFARPPINTSGNFLPHVSAESPLNISPNLSEVISEVSEP